MQRLKHLFFSYITLKVGSFGGRYRLGAVATYRCNPGFLLWGNRLMMFHLKRFFSAYVSEVKKVYFMSRSFTEPAFSRTATNRVKQLTTSTQNTFTFQNCHSYFGWKNTMSSAQFSGCSSSYCASLVLELHLLTSPLLLASDMKKGKDTSMLGTGKWC